MISLKVNGEWRDYIFKKLDPGVYAFYLDKELLGQVRKVGRAWTAVSNRSSNSPKEISAMCGFRTRLDAVNFLLIFRGYLGPGL